MVYGLNIVSADTYLYAAEPLDGNIAAIRTLDRSPDGGVGFESVNGGRRCHTDHFPTRMLWKGPGGSIIGDFNRQNLVNVSEKAKGFIEVHEPGVHQFVPVDFIGTDGNVLDHRYALVVCNRLDSVDREQTTFVLEDGKAWASAKNVARRGKRESIPPHIDPAKPGRFVFKRGQIGSAKIWRDGHMDLGDILISNDFAAALRASGLTGFNLKPDGEGMEEV